MEFATDNIGHVRFDADILKSMSMQSAHVVAAARAIAANISAHAPQKSCVVELEAVFPNLTPLAAQFVLTAFDAGCAPWVRKDDEWQEVTDSFVRMGKELMRVRSVAGGKREHRVKTLLGRLVCTGAQDIQVKLNVKTEHEPSSKALKKLALGLPESVRRQTRREFVHHDQDGSVWSYVTGQAWAAPTGREAEALMVAEDNTRGRSTVVEIETEIEWKTEEPPEPDRLLLLAASLIVKVQDVLTVLTGSSSVEFGQFKRTRASVSRRPPIPRPTRSVVMEKRSQRKRSQRKRKREKALDVS